jgi:uncharacterized phage protein gp47/JayE
MADPTPSFQDLVDIGQAEAKAVRPSLVFADGDQSTAVINGGAAMCDSLAGWFAGQIRAMFFNGAVDDELDTIIMDRTEIPRNPASAAYGLVTFARSGSGSADVITSGTQEQSPPDLTGATSVYLTDYDLPYPSGAFSLTVPATCSLPGPSGNFAGGTLRIIDALPDPSITATTAGFAGGNDAERDQHYLVRAVTHYLTARRATLAALEEGALDAAGVTVASAIEDPDTGLVYVRVSDDSGGSTTQMAYLTEVAMEDWRAAGVDVEGQGLHASALVLVITLMEYADGFDVPTAAPAIITSVTNRLAGSKPGQKVTLDEIRLAAGGPFATQIQKMTFTITLDGVLQTDSTADIVPASGKAIHLQSCSVVDGKAP